MLFDLLFDFEFKNTLLVGDIHLPWFLIFVQILSYLAFQVLSGNSDSVFQKLF